MWARFMILETVVKPFENHSHASVRVIGLWLEERSQLPRILSTYPSQLSVFNLLIYSPVRLKPRNNGIWEGDKPNVG